MWHLLLQCFEKVRRGVGKGTTLRYTVMSPEVCILLVFLHFRKIPRENFIKECLSHAFFRLKRLQSDEQWKTEALARALSTISNIKVSSKNITEKKLKAKG